MEIEILFEDDYLLVVNKPSGISTQANADGLDCLLDFFKPTVHAVNRLDQRVSGLLLLAKNTAMQTALTAAMQQQNFVKKYLAVVGNLPKESEATITHWLLKNGTAKKVKAFNKPVAYAVKASLQYTLLQSSQRYHLLQVQLQNGAFHQIRAQLAAINCPIVGDVKYGFKRTTADGSIFLQSNELQFIHPISKESVACTLPYPTSWQQYGIGV